MKKISLLLAAFALISFSSCSLKKELQNCQEESKVLQNNWQATKDKLSDAEKELAVANTRISGLESQINALQKSNADLQKSLEQSLSTGSQQNVNVAKLVDQINESNQYIRHLTELKSKSDSLNLILTNNLTRSLSREELKDIDVQVLKGVVYISLSDNMLYKSGSYEISSRARETLSKIAKIITDYDDYDVLVEGNTDTVPISKTNIRNNWDLSCLRASSVVQYLQNNFGVNPSRLTAGGRGEYNPIADNDTDAGRSRNRRTQIIITPKLDQFMDLLEKSPNQ